MKNWVAIQYREFYDVPRIFVVTYRGQSILFSGLFDEEIDEYPDKYRVYLLPQLTGPELQGDWSKLHLKAHQFVCEVPVDDVKFDPIRRKEIEAAVLDKCLAALHS